MIELKGYQQRALETLSNYFNRCVMLDNADTAFYETTRDVYGQGIPYNNLKELPGIPCVCIRIPTGGGKTIVACHAINVAAQDLLQTTHPLVLWLVPSNAILDQTINALRNPQHPYRQALEGTIGRVNICDVHEALSLKRATLSAETTIIVSTIQAFRVDNTEGRKVYEDSGSLMDHGEDLTARGFVQDGAVIRSLANVINIWRPIIIVDEAHNARTPLSFSVLARFNPSCILEFSATPETLADGRSNIVHSVSSAELKADAMIKMPIALETRTDWKELLSDAISMRNHLETQSQIERQINGEYIRPIMLIQAQPTFKDKESITVDVVEKCLLEDHKIPREQIAIATGKINELDKEKNILSPESKIKYVITVQALKEGWDCPFAYILCSVAELRSSTAVEQILGRIMRLPKATWKSKAGLNMAYAYSASQSFYESANALTDCLIKNGFNKQEAKDLIVALPKDEDTTTPNLFNVQAVVTVKSEEVPDIADVSPDLKTKLTLTEEGAISFKGVMDESDRTELKKCFKTPEGKAVVEAIYRKSRGMKIEKEGTPSERGVEFSIPVLSIKQGDLFETFEDTHFLDRPWNLSECSALLSETEFPKETAQGQHGIIDISDRGQVGARLISNLQEELKFLDTGYVWDVHSFAKWIDDNIKHEDFSLQEAQLFLRNLVNRLIEERGFTLEQLVHDKYRLRKAVIQKIESHRKDANKKAYQSLLFPECATPLEVSPENCFTYDELQYPYNVLYKGSYKFNKHYYPQIGGLNGEELECAQFIDSQDEVEFWVRNIEKRPLHSFWLQTSSDKFYPDFVCKLKNGKYLVVEYKGADRWSDDDSKEKRALGGLWESRSNGTCLFVMPKGKSWADIKAKLV